MISTRQFNKQNGEVVRSGSCIMRNGIALECMLWLANSAKLAFIAVDTEWRMKVVSDAAANLLGCTDSKLLLGKVVKNIYPKSTRKRLNAAFIRLLKQRRQIHVKTEIVNTGEQLIKTEQSISMLSCSADTDPCAIILITPAIHSIGEFDSLRDAVPEGIFEADLEGNIVLANQYALEAFGCDEADLAAGLTIHRLIDEQDHERMSQNFERVLKGGVSPRNEYQGRRKDGSHFPVIVRSQPIYSNGELAGIRGIVIDLTQLRRHEAEQLRDQKLESLSILAGGIAHDFNNLLTGILGNIGLAKVDSEIGGEAYQCLEEAERAGLRAKDLSRQLVTFSRGGEPVRRPVVVDHLVRESATLALRESTTEITYEFAADLWLGDIDRGQVSQVIHNLVLNASQAMSKSGKLSIRAGNSIIAEGGHPALGEGRYVRLDFIDNGSGIPENKLSKIFDPYFTTKSSGTGLGLSSVHSIVKRHGGHIEVQSDVDSGTKFTVFLPASLATEEEIQWASPDSTFGSGRILIMDDEQFIRELGRKILTKYGYDVALVSHGDEAVQVVNRASEIGHPYDVVILDLVISGGLGGKETVRRLKEIDPNIRAIVCSGYSRDPVVSDYKTYGFDAAIQKPFRPIELAGVVGTLLNKSEINQPSA